MPVTSLRWSRSGRWVLECIPAGYLQFSNLTRGSLSPEEGVQHQGGNRPLASRCVVPLLVLALYRFILSAGFDGQTRIWDVRKGHQVTDHVGSTSRCHSPALRGSGWGVVIWFKGLGS